VEFPVVEEPRKDVLIGGPRDWREDIGFMMVGIEPCGPENEDEPLVEDGGCMFWFASPRCEIPGPLGGVDMEGELIEGILGECWWKEGGKAEGERPG
jgi:hypothetical protein